jgi:RNA polymerase sigma factor (sigma-70 family)
VTDDMHELWPAGHLPANKQTDVYFDPPPDAMRAEHGASDQARGLFERLAELPPDDPERARIRGQLVELHLPLVKYLARRFRNRGEWLDDLTQVATIGLIKAIDRFDLDRGVEFSTYATPTIVGEIKRHFRDKGWAVRVPRRVQELKLSLTKAIGDLAQREGRAPTVSELASHLQMSEEEVLEGLESANAYSTVLLDAPDSGDEDKSAVFDSPASRPLGPEPDLSMAGEMETPRVAHERGTGRPEGPPGGAAGGGKGDEGGSLPGDSADGGVPPARRRYLMGQCPESVPVGKPFSLLASIVLAPAPGPTSAELKSFNVPPEGRDVHLVIHAPGLQLLSDQQQTVHVPAEADSGPVRFELRADRAGPLRVSITAWIGGSYLGELPVEITAERYRSPGPDREVLTEITTESVQGAVSLVVRYDPRQNAYRFEFRDEDNPDEVTSHLSYDPGPHVEHLVADLDDLTKGRSGYSAAQTREYLVNAGAALWSQLVPEALREQFWDRQHRIQQLTILSDQDVVPWELLYPLDPGHDAGFLIEQFPVTRAIFRRRPARTLRLWPARFVLPEGSLREARQEIDAMRQLLDPGQPPDEVISALTPLTDLIGTGDFGLLHFACHNTYDPADGSSIKLGNVQLTPTLLTRAVIQKVLMGSAPTVFINACRSAGFAATYNRLDGWASKFLEAGAAAFIGSLWAVSDGTAREFAQELYGELRAGSPLGEAAMRARQVAADQLDDPTWLAYTVYGDPRARVSQRR